MTRIENEFHLTRPIKQVVVGVHAFPDEVQVEVGGAQVNLTIAEALSLAEGLTKAASLAGHIDWDEAAPENAPALVLAGVASADAGPER